MIRQILIASVLFFSLSLNAQQIKDCSECSTRLIRQNELSGFTNAELRILKNEIFARKGYSFSSKDLKEHFSKFAWYKPMNNNSKVKLNDIETKNIATIDKYVSDGEDPGTAATNRVFEEVIDNKDKYLTEEEIEQHFSSSAKAKLGIKYTIWKAYAYSDKSGQEYFLVLSENKYYNKEHEKELGNKIQAVNFKHNNGKNLIKTFELNDFIIDPPASEEDNINFFTRYTLVEDFDKDGIVEPIIIYGARGVEYGYDNSWIKILIYRNNVKTRVWIHNSEFDEGRGIEVDKSFYSLPKPIQTKVIMQMEEMQKNGHCYLGHTWKEKMKKGITKISD